MNADKTPTLNDRFWHASGGLLWHWRAWHHGHRWQVFRTDIAGLLQAWDPAERALLLIGPSAGWTLPEDFVQRFDTVSAVEPDPLARLLFTRRFTGVSPLWLNIDAFADGGLEALLAQCPGHAVLFCNVAGQVLPDDADTAARRCEALREALADRTWASYHDLVSLDTATDPGPGPDREEGLRWHLADSTLEEILGSHGRRGRVELLDHHTASLARGLISCTLPWPLHPGRLHLVQWVAVKADEPPR